MRAETEGRREITVPLASLGLMELLVSQERLGLQDLVGQRDSVDLL